MTVAKIDEYLGQVAAALPGPARARADIVAELRSGLFDAAEAHQSAGLPAPDAAAAAVAEFGDLHEVVAGFYPELAARQSRRTALLLALGAIPVGLLWLSAAKACHPASRGMWPVSLLPVPFAAAALLISVATAMATVAATGRLTRWLPARPQAAAAIAAAGGAGVALADVIICVLLVHELLLPRDKLAVGPVLLAGLATIVRLVLTRRAVHRCLAVRATPA